MSDVAKKRIVADPAYRILDALEALDALTVGDDPVEAHVTADDILFRTAPKPVQVAYRRARARVGFGYDKT